MTITHPPGGTLPAGAAATGAAADDAATGVAAAGDAGDAVRLTAATKVYGSGDRAVTALDDLTVRFPAGTFTAMMGPSGSGKSTLLQCAAGLEPLTSGTATVTGVDLATLTERRRTVLRRDRLGFVFQAFNLVESLTAAQNVELPVRLAGRRPSRDTVRAALAGVGLADRADHRPAELSGGQQQRVAIARALVNGPQVVFADEPTGALDTATSREVLALLRAAVDANSRTVIMVTHDPMAASFADQVLFLSDGRLVDRMVGRPRTTHYAERIAARTARWESAGGATA